MTAIARFFPSAIGDPKHADAFLELAFQMTAVDGRLEEAEVRAFRELASAVFGREIPDEDVVPIVDRYAVSIEKDAIAARVRELAPELPPELRETAFKVVMSLALVDRDAAADEDELMGVFFEALGLSEARADALAAEVRAAFAP
jgi:uncharacterized tellurite resistance protein B-like protein